MSATLQATGLAAGHGARVLFSGLDLVLAPGDVVGLVGANGAGKSTLLRLLAGETVPEEGRIGVSPPTATVGHLPQEPDRQPGETVAAFVARRTGVTQAQVEMDAAAEALGMALVLGGVVAGQRLTQRPKPKGIPEPESVSSLV